MIDFNTILSFLQTLSIMVGIAYYIMNIQNNQRNQESAIKNQEITLETRQTQLFMTFYQQMFNKQFVKDMLLIKWEWKDYEDFKAKYGQETNPEAYTALMAAENFVECIAILIHQGLLDIKLPNELIGAWIISLWDKFEPIIKEMRKEMNIPSMYNDHEQLYGELKQYRATTT